MTDWWRGITDSACVAASAVYEPTRRRRENALRADHHIDRILVCNDVGGLGNVVLLSGLLLNLRRMYPAARIAVAMPRSSLAGALLGKDLVDEMLCFDPAGGRYSVLSFAWQTLRPRRFDLGLATFFSPTLLTACALAVAGCRYRIAYAQDLHRGVLNTITLVDDGGHELDRHLRLLDFTGRRLERRTAVSLAPHYSDEASRWLIEEAIGIERPLLGVHPGCDRVNALKRWPAERFVSVIKQVVSDDLADVAIFLGPDDTDLRTSFAGEIGPRVRLICVPSIERVAALVGKCHAFLSNDSGLMHVAAALDVPVVAVFGPTDTIKNAPVGLSTILTASDVPCRPCYAAPPITCIHERRHCLEDIAVDRVIKVLTQTLASARCKTAPTPLSTEPEVTGHAA